MPSVYDIKPRFQALLRPLVRRMASVGVRANQVTVAAMLVSLLVGLVVGCAAGGQRWIWGILPLWLLLRMALNAIDGMLAREHGQSSRLGAVLNELGDVVADAGLYLPLALTPAFSLWPLAVFVLLATWTEMTGVIGVQIGASRRYDGPLGKSDRALVFGVLGLLLALGVPVRSWDNVVWALALLCAWTVFNRARAALRELGE
ncbi:CDP-alcohol phosphatidyltransferase family protein [Rhodanobacter sp. 7MK24]|uniref:CDP-alcohol phosphatidyltransferase family protein n=1 Tax=Rhodanobacter sp. 7MK24 TaxID=2775922 RepID=UPI00177D5FBB|nr:CDP-alcohol phosphatidyltransferase family protein [Rhodanobacter sp. 7MK24]MBD8880071.1 CDP-alcohol phosphatidyltransferase family protein [Rhodanobacter sp. 7MK24]